MHDIRAIRDDPEAFHRALQRRGLELDAQSLVDQYAQLTRLRREKELLISENERQSKEAYALAKNQASVSSVAQQSEQEQKAWISNMVSATRRAAGRILQEKLQRLDPSISIAQHGLEKILSALPNIPFADVPDGTDESGNVEQKAWGEKPVFAFVARDHADLGPALGLDFEGGARLSGARFTVLRGGAAKLSRALGQYMLDQHGANGHEEIAPPVLVRKEAMFGTTQLPKFAEDSFETTDGRWLIPTSEVSLTNLVREQILPAATLPLRMTALTPCFRSEAGSAGRDTRGLIRQHQFDKVELVTICAPDAAAAEHERMTLRAESILEALGLPYRRMLLCAGDMGFAARKTYDLEVWLPGQGQYREISSCSDCGDFQARRMEARYRPEGGKPAFVHTLNGSGLAVGRALVAVIENYQEADGGVRVPDVLRPYLGGLARIGPA